MLPLINAIRKHGLASPYGAVLAASVIFLVGWLFPPQLYATLMVEPDRMFLDPLTFCVFFSCAAAYVLGLRGRRFFFGQIRSPQQQTVNPRWIVLYFVVPLTVACAVALVALIKYNARISLVALLVAQQGQEIKDYQAYGNTIAEGIWVNVPLIFIAVLWWAFFRLRQIPMNRGIRNSLYVAWCLGCGISGFISIALVDRATLIGLLMGIAMIAIHFRERAGARAVGKTLVVIVGWSTLILGFFVLVAALRGNFGSRLLITSLMGYTIAVYNRLASVVHGQLTYFYAGRGVYLIEYLQDATTLNNIFHYKEMLHWPDRISLWKSEFSSVMLAGLNGRYNAAGVFGYLFADIGWWALVYLFLAGVLTDYLWAKFKAGAATAIAAYPWFFIWIVWWSEANRLLSIELVHLVMGGIVLAGWDWMFISSTSLADTSGHEIGGPAHNISHLKTDVPKGFSAG